VPRQAVPSGPRSGRLYAAYHLPGSPFKASQWPSGRAGQAGLSGFNTMGVSGCEALRMSCTSGVVQTLAITLVDEWGNPRSAVAAAEGGTPVSGGEPARAAFQEQPHEDGLSALVQSLSNEPNPNERLQLAFSSTSAATYLASYSLSLARARPSTGWTPPSTSRPCRRLRVPPARRRPTSSA
jgi:hypothetical protein